MTEHPINLHPHEVRALLAGRLTQLRRLVKPQPLEAFCGPEIYAPCRVDRHGKIRPGAEVFGIYSADGEWGVECPFGRPGDVLWGRETWQYSFPPESFATDSDMIREVQQAKAERRRPDRCLLHYRASGKLPLIIDAEGEEVGWRSPVGMPRWASRITLCTTNTRVERLQEISAKDILASGVVDRPHVDKHLGKCPVSAVDKCCYVDLISLWAAACCKLHGKDSWSLNPWVWIGHVERVESAAAGGRGE